MSTNHQENKPSDEIRALLYRAVRLLEQCDGLLTDAIKSDDDYLTIMPLLNAVSETVDAYHDIDIEEIGPDWLLALKRIERALTIG